MAKTKNKPLIRTIHFKTLIFLAIYIIISKIIFIRSVAHANIFISFLGPFFFGLIATYVFLYLFSHEDFFHFMRAVEKEEKPKEDSYIAKYHHHGRILATILIGTIGGPIFLALTARFLLNNYWYKNLVIVVASFTSTIFFVAITEGIIQLF